MTAPIPLKFTLNQQVEEVVREIDERNRDYPGLVRKGRLRESQAEYHISRMKSVLATLAWLRDNETSIRADVLAGAPIRRAIQADAEPAT